jgi:hypothetical protein
MGVADDPVVPPPPSKVQQARPKGQRLVFSKLLTKSSFS